MALSKQERWLDNAALKVRACRAATQDAVLTPRQRMTEILALVSRSMRETGDLAAARRRDPAFLVTGRLLATNLAFPCAMQAFAGSEAGLERQFFALFDSLCAELRALETGGTIIA